MARMRSRYMSPNGQPKSDWTAVGAATGWQATAKGPGTVAAPSLTTYVESTTDAHEERFSFPDINPEPGEYVSFLRLHVYASTPANHTLKLGVYYAVSGTPYQVGGVPVTDIPASSSAGWFSTSKLTPRRNTSTHDGELLTNDDLNNVTVEIELDETSAQASTSKVYAVVLEVGLSEMQHLDMEEGTSLPGLDLFFAKGKFVEGHTREPWQGYGYQYDDDAYWKSATTALDQLTKMKRYGANYIRAFIGPGNGMMTNQTTVVEAEWAKFERFLEQAEGVGLRVDVSFFATQVGAGLSWEAPAWFDALSEANRIIAMTTFHTRLAKATAGSPAVTHITLINEPIVKPTDSTVWAIGFGQFLHKTRSGRTDEEIVDDTMDPLIAGVRTWEPTRGVATGAWGYAAPTGGGAYASITSEATRMYGHDKGTVVVDHQYPTADGPAPYRDVYGVTPQLAWLRELSMLEKPVVLEESGWAGQDPDQEWDEQTVLPAHWEGAQQYVTGTIGQWFGLTLEEDVTPAAVQIGGNYLPFLAFLSTTGSDLERFTLDDIELHEGHFQIEALTLDPPAKKYTRQVLRNGSLPAELPGYEDRTIQIRLRVQASVDEAAAQNLDRAFDFIGHIRAKLQQADQLVTEGKRGLASTWQAANSTRPMTVYVTGGDITEIPKVTSGDDVGYFYGHQPVFNLTLTCHPFLYGETVTLVGSTQTGPLGTMTISGTLGDVHADAELMVRESSGQDRRFVEWGMQHHNYTLSGLVLDSDSVTTSGYSGTSTTHSGAYDPNATGNNVVRVTPTSVPLTMCGMLDQTHIGRFRVRGRFFAADTNVPDAAESVKVRLRIRIGKGEWQEFPWVNIPLFNAWTEPELCSLVLPKVDTPIWDWELECLGTAGQTDTLDFDYLSLLPVDEGYGLSRAASPSIVTSALVANDNFDTLTAAASLNARTAPLGGNWATSASGGSPADFVGSTPAGSVLKTGTSESPNIRRALIATSRTTCEVGALFWGQRWGPDELPSLQETTRRGLIARYVNGTNYLLLGSGAGNAGVYLISHTTADGAVAHASMTNFNGQIIPHGTWIFFRLVVYDNGIVYWSVQPVTRAANGVVTYQAIIQNGAVYIAACATGGALESGQAGFESFNWTATDNVTFVDNFYVSTTPPVEQPVIPKGSRIKFGSANRAPAEHEVEAERWAKAPYRGARFLLPPSLGDSTLNTRMAWRSYRYDLNTAASDGLTDQSEARVVYTPRYLDVPRV